MDPITAWQAELDQESKATRRLLERVPEEKLAWKPHAKSMSLGELALHIASVPGILAEFLSVDTLELPDTTQPAPKSKQEILAAFEENLTKTKKVLSTFTGERVNQTWRLTKRGQELMAAPRITVVRPFLFSHLYHHRGQMTVYLRLLGVAVPAIYGPSADENPFATSAAASSR
jgi:uncharacterized damage-inducible protein DinB